MDMDSATKRMMPLLALSLRCWLISATARRCRFVMSGPGSSKPSCARILPISEPVSPMLVSPRASAIAVTTPSDSGGCRVFGMCLASPIPQPGT